MPTRVPLREYSSEDAGRATESSEYGAPRTSKRTSRRDLGQPRRGERGRGRAGGRESPPISQPAHPPAGNGPAPLSLGIAWVCSDRSTGPSMDDVDGVALMWISRRRRRGGGFAARHTRTQELGDGSNKPRRDNAANRALGRRAAILKFCGALWRRCGIVNMSRRGGRAARFAAAAAQHRDLCTPRPAEKQQYNPDPADIAKSVTIAL